MQAHLDLLGSCKNRMVHTLLGSLYVLSRVVRCCVFLRLHCTMAGRNCSAPYSIPRPIHDPSQNPDLNLILTTLFSLPHD